MESFASLISDLINLIFPVNFIVNWGVNKIYLFLLKKTQKIVVLN